MKMRLLLALGVSLPALAFASQAKPTIVVNTFTAASDVVWPYDMKVMQAQTVAEFKVKLGKDFEIVAERRRRHGGRSIHWMSTLPGGARGTRRNDSSSASARAANLRTFTTGSPTIRAKRFSIARIPCEPTSTRRAPVRSAR